MLTYQEALALVLSTCQEISPQEEKVALSAAANRVLSEPLKAPFDLPRFNNSAVDGFGVLVEDLLQATEEDPKVLTLTGAVAAGDKSEILENGHLSSGTCIKILTGAPVPDSVEAVVMREYCQENGQSIAVCTRTKIGENIRMTGEELEEGTVVLKPGTKLTPPAIGLAATVGAHSMRCYKQPVISVVSTGDELVEPGHSLTLSQIYNSNSYAVIAALLGQDIQADKIRRLHTIDEEKCVEETLAEALNGSDVLITLGGVSMGDKDFVKSTLEKMGAKTVFWRAKIKPGKPIYFAVLDKKIIFGLPGNPVSALVTFHLFVKPALRLLQGIAGDAPQRLVRARLSASLKKKSGRLDFVRVILTRDEKGLLHAAPTVGQDSHMLTGLLSAGGLLHFDEELEYLPEGAEVLVELVDW